MARRRAPHPVALVAVLLLCINPAKAHVPARKALRSRVRWSSAGGASLAVEDTPAPRREDVRAVLTVGLPVLGSCLMSPLTSLVDTWSVSRLSPQGAPLGLAAIELNSAVFGLVEGSFSFLNVAMTKAVAQAGTKSKVEQATVARDGAVLAIVLGCLSMVALIHWNANVLQCFDASGELLESARTYLAIRATSLPATVANYALTAICLACQSVPSSAFLISAMVNLVGDVVLVFLGGGVLGVAAASSISGWVQFALLVNHIRRVTGLMQVAGKRKGLPTWRDLRPFLAVSGTALELGRPFPPPIVRRMTPASFPLPAGAAFVVQMLSSVTWSLAGRSVALCHDPSVIGAHQLLGETSYFLTCASIPLSLASQSLLPGRRHEHVHRLVGTVLSMSVGLGVVGAAIVQGVATVGSTCLSKSPSITAILRTFSPVAALSVFFGCVNSALYGINIGLGALRSFFAINAVSSVVGAAGFFLVPRGDFPPPTRLLQTWWTIVAFTGLKAALGLAQLPRLMSSVAHADSHADTDDADHAAS